MEEALGTRLFERTNRITALTPAGNVLQKEAVTTLMQMERSMLLTRRAGQGMTGALRIGFVATAVRHLLPEMIARFHFSFPQVVLELNEMTTARQVASLWMTRLTSVLRFYLFLNTQYRSCLTIDFLAAH